MKIEKRRKSTRGPEATPTEKERKRARERERTPKETKKEPLER